MGCNPVNSVPGFWVPPLHNRKRHLSFLQGNLSCRIPFEQACNDRGYLRVWLNELLPIRTNNIAIILVMKAMIMDRHGGLDILRYGGLPDPVAQAGQVVVDVHAASINGADVKVREGAYVTISTFPHVPEPQAGEASGAMASSEPLS